MKNLLAGIRSLTDLPALSNRLGCQPWFEEVPHPSGNRSHGLAAVVGKRGEFVWYGAAGPGAGPAARAIASRLARAGECSGVLALDPSARHLAVAVSELPVPCRVLNLDQPSPLDLSILGRIPDRSGVGPPVAIAGRIAEVLRLEDAGVRFFRAFRELLGNVAEEVKDYTGPGSRAQVALLQLTRILFLYFVQSKGWLDGRRGFLREEIDRCLGARRHLHRQFLKPLFFGTLNRPADARGAAAGGFGSIPFLNGGLFEPHPIEQSWRGTLPNHVLRAAFDDVFERFAFTVHESGAENTIAPDMLGRVFEGVMAPAHRRASGSFYTPAGLVTQVLDQALAAYLRQRHGMTRSRAQDILTHPTDSTRSLLQGITLLDPAVGSGAFLVGALEKLTSLHLPARGHGHRVRRQILARLHGVDRDAMAVRITELRLWLAVIADDPARMPRRVRPLPNLDCLVRQGDSLLSPGGWMGQLATRAPGQLAALAGRRKVFLTATGTRKAAAARELRREEHTAACRRAEWAERVVYGVMRQSIADARSPDLFGQATRMTAVRRNQFALSRRRWHEARSIRRHLHADRSVPWFEYEVQFGDIVTDRGGFDIVLGNPPWVRAERLPARLREHLSERYSWWRTAGAPRSNGMRHQPDLSIAFLERGLELAAPGGIVAFLLPAKITSAGYAERARQALRLHYHLHTVARLESEDEGAFTATVYPLLLVAGKAAPGSDVPIATSLDPRTDGVSWRDLPATGPWVLRSADAARLHSRLREMPRLGEAFTVRLGVKTGANSIFLDQAAPVEEALRRPVLRGRDLTRPESGCSGRIIWTHDDDGLPLVALPPDATRWFESHRAALIRRSDYRGGPVWQVFRTEGLRKPWRVVWADLARSLRPIVTGRDVIPLNTCYYIPCDDPALANALASWLGSTWVRAAAALVADPASGGYARFNARCIEGLPWPPNTATDPVLIAGKEPEEVDHAVAYRLGLSPAERRLLGGVARRSPCGG